MINEERIIIQLTPEHRGPKSDTFTGRPQGVQVRQQLGLDKLDKDVNSYVVTIPENTTSFNASFFLGLFFESIIHLGGIENFKVKYLIESLETNKDIKVGILEDLNDCERQAINEFYGETGLDF